MGLYRGFIDEKDTKFTKIFANVLLGHVAGLFSDLGYEVRKIYSSDVAVSEE